MRLPRFRIRALMIAVAVIALVCVPGRSLVRWVLGRTTPGGRYYYGKYVAPDGRVTRGGIIFVRPDGAILVD